jgi:TonB family protein
MRIRSALFLALVLFYSFQPLGRAYGQITQNARKIVRKVDPQYPAIARNMNLGGTVKVIAVVGLDGSVKRVDPLGGSPILVQAAQNAVSQWKFVPGAESRETVELHFTP